MNYAVLLIVFVLRSALASDPACETGTPGGADGVCALTGDREAASLRGKVREVRCGKKDDGQPVYVVRIEGDSGMRTVEVPFEESAKLLKASGKKLPVCGDERLAKKRSPH